METFLVLILIIAIVKTVLTKLSKYMDIPALGFINKVLNVANALCWVIFFVEYAQADEIDTSLLFLLGAILGYGVYALVEWFFEDIMLQDNPKEANEEA